MSNWQVAVVVLGAVLVGSAVPVLLQLRATLRALETALREALPRVEDRLAEVSKLAIEASRVVEGMQSTTRVVGALGAAIGPAILAGISSYRASRGEPSTKEDRS